MRRFLNFTQGAAVLALIAAMTAYSLSMSLSPGPVNIAIASSGASHGVRRTLPFVSGATIGFTLLLVAVGLSYGWLTAGISSAMMVLELLGAAFIAWMGLQIASADAGAGLEQREALSFTQGFLLQWMNPKAWIACAAGAAMFSEPASRTSFILFTAIYFVICYLSLGAWAVLGHHMAFFLTSRRRVQGFNWLMGGLLIASAAWMALPRIGGLLAGMGS
jgi:threonine/homoserine/homoserine lactone efflux protein